MEIWGGGGRRDFSSRRKAEWKEVATTFTTGPGVPIILLHSVIYTDLSVELHGPGALAWVGPGYQNPDQSLQPTWDLQTFSLLAQPIGHCCTRYGLFMISVLYLLYLYCETWCACATGQVLPPYLSTFDGKSA